MAAAMGYVRVSTTMQVQDGVSLEAQRAKIEAWCALQDYPLADLWVDAGVSGAKMQNRPGLQAALQACGPGDVLVVYSLSRLSRSVRDTLDLSDRLTQAGVDLVSLSEKIDTTSAAGKMVFRLLSVMAEFERDQIVERVKFGMAYKKARKGRVGTINYGYQLATDGVTLIEDDHEQRIRAAMRQDRQSGLSLRAIVARLQERGVVSRSGQPFQLTQVARILKD